MSEDVTTPLDPTNDLQQQLETANKRLVQAELQNRALRAGMIDLELLKLVDTSTLKVDASGGVPAAAETVARLQREKPWMFANSSSSQAKPAPAPEPPKARNALTMTRAEWQTARERLLRGR